MIIERIRVFLNKRQKEELFENLEERKRFFQNTVEYVINLEDETVSCYEYENGRDILVVEDDDFQGTLDWLNKEKGKAKIKFFGDEIELYF